MMLRLYYLVLSSWAVCCSPSAGTVYVSPYRRCASEGCLKEDLNNAERTCLLYIYIYLDIKHSSACFITFV